MKIRRSKSLVAVLLMLAMAGAMAQQGQGWQQQPGNAQPRGNERVRSFALPENSGFGSGSNVARGNPYEQSQQQPNKMSPEDRRTLRRQINEAGHDIYTPSR